MPQFLLFCVNNEFQSESTRKEIREKYSNLSPFTIINSSLQLNVALNQLNRATKSICSTKIDRNFHNNEPKPYQVKAYYLYEPTIYVIGKRDNGKFETKIQGNDIKGKEWGSKIGGLRGPPWEEGSLYSSRNWCIVCDSAPNGGGIFATNKIIAFYRQFVNQRGFKPKPFNEPDVFSYNFTNIDLNKLRDDIRGGNIKFDVVVCVIPFSTEGSKLKIDITNAINRKEIPSYTVSDGCNSRCNTPINGTSQRRVSSYSSYNNYSNDNSYSKDIEIGTSKRSNVDRIDTQFVTENQASKKMSVFGVLEAMIDKSGFETYEIEPNLPSKMNRRLNISRDQRFPVFDSWAIGLKISKDKGKTKSNSRSGLNTVIMGVMQKPMNGSLSYVHSHSSLLPKDRNVIPRDYMKQMMQDMLIRGLKKIIENNPRHVRKGESLKSKLPLNLVFLRTNVGKGAFANVASKEVCAIVRIFEQISQASISKNQNRTNCNNSNSKPMTSSNSNSISNSISNSNNVNRNKFDEKTMEIVQLLRRIMKLNDNQQVNWKPGIIYSVVQDRVMDSFGSLNAKDGVPNGPIVVSNDITSGEISNFIIQFPKPQGGKKITKVLKYFQLYDNIVLRNGTRIRMCENRYLLSDFIQYVYSLHWSYCPNIPFVQTKPDYPGPIKMVDHFSEWQMSQITKGETSLNDLKTDQQVDSAKPQFVIPTPTK